MGISKVFLLFQLLMTLAVGLEKGYFTQKLNHFDPEDTRTFQQKYYIDDTFWKKNGPIFLYISGEAPCSGLPNNEFSNLAKEFSGMMVTLEHRYYGESSPFLKLSTENLKYLSSKQAIVDLASFVSWVSSRNPSSKWFTVGCSYAGALAAFFRLKFPHLTSGSWSSSGVVNAVLDFTAFDQQVSLAVGKECTQDLQAITKQVEEQMEEGNKSKEKLKSLFGTTNFEDDDFIFLIADVMAESVQYGFGKQLCKTIHQQFSLEAFANFTKDTFYPNFGPPDSYRISYQQNEQAPNAERTWWFQKCTEFAFFQNAPSENSIRSKLINMNWHKKRCEKLFGPNVWPDTNETNTYYGGPHIQATKTFFVDSSQDPWKAASVDISPNIRDSFQMVHCSNCGHCSELRGCPSLPNYFNLDGCDDPNHEVTFARRAIFQKVGQWLGS